LARIEPGRRDLAEGGTASKEGTYVLLQQFVGWGFSRSGMSVALSRSVKTLDAGRKEAEAVTWAS